MRNNKRDLLKRALERQLNRIDKQLERLNRWSRRISMYRLWTFLSGSVFTFLAIRYGSTWIGVFVPLLFLALFIALVAWHQKIERTHQKFDIWKNIRVTHLARMDLDWNNIPATGYFEEYENHPYAEDLNITGQHSLRHLMDTSIYKGGRTKLTNWLLENDSDRKRIEIRQELVKELKPMSHFRDRLLLRAVVTKSQGSEKDWDMPRLLRWLEVSKADSYLTSLTILGSLAASNIVLVILFLAGVLPPYFFFTFILYLTIYSLNSNKIKGLFDSAYQIEKLLSRFSSLLIYLESFPYRENSRLKEFCSMYHQADTRPSRFLRRIIWLASAASSQSSELLWALLNLLMPWDLYFSYRLNRYKAELKGPLNRWLDRFHDLEALCSIANFAWLNPDYIFVLPGTEQVQPVLKAGELGHPLIPRGKKVCNDVTIERNGSLLLITGSNMAGKSTFLRTLGINLCLCFSGGPVNADAFQTILFRLFSSINVTDSLDEGISHFYAEVRKLRRLLDELERDSRSPLFYLVDEIFRGTNNRERLIGSTAFLKHVAGKNGVGVISTHDLELASLEKEIPELTNSHFEETIKDGKMSFEYKLKPGPCPTTNALTIMQMEGLPVNK